MGVIGVQQQLELFAGLAYLLSLNRVRMPDGTLVDQKRFNVLFPGRYAFDAAGQHAGTAWHAFTRNQAYSRPLG